MAKDDPNRIAIHEGIGARLKELGFKRKSERLYVREDDQFEDWVRFELSGRDAFIDISGVLLKGLDETFDNLGLDLWRYGEFGKRNAHVGRSAIRLWGISSDASLAAYHLRRRRYGWLVWQFWASEARWSATDPYVQSPYTGKGGWQCAANPAGCAAESLQKWRELVEPWFEAMRDKKAFVREYAGLGSARVPPLSRAVACAWADETESAVWYLNEICRDADRPIETFRRGIAAAERRASRRISAAELDESAETLAQSHGLAASRARQVAKYFNLDLKANVSHPRNGRAAEL